LVMEPGARVDGIVTTPDGASIEGVEVAILQGGPPAPMMMRRPPGGGGQPPAAVTGPDGRFLIEDLARGEPLNLSFSRVGYLSKTESGVDVPRDEPLAVTLQPSSKVSGRVTGPDKKPIPGAQVSLTRRQSGGIGNSMFKMIMRDGASADDQGTFVFDNVGPGQVSLSAVAPGWQEAKLEGIEVPEGKD